MTELTGKSIVELTQAPSINNSTNIVVQRQGSPRAEKTQLAEVTKLVTDSTELNEKVQISVVEGVNLRLSQHTSASDPHGDRAFATSSMNTHLSTNDPHGDRAYADSKINTHRVATDPHGDRAFTTSAITTHSASSDPHGDRAYTLSQINSHRVAADPHGDRAYALSLMNIHKTTELDPHGDRAYSDSALLTHKSEEDPHGLKSLLNTLLNEHNTSQHSHDLDTKLATIPTTVNDAVNSALSQRLGSSIAPIVNGKVPETYIRTNVMFSNLSQFPVTGSTNVLYIDTTTRKMYVWATGGYKDISPTVELSGISLSTDDVAPGTNPNRQYLTSTLKTSYDNKLSNITSLGGLSLVTKTGSNAFVKGLESDSSITLIDRGNSIALNTNYFKYVAKYNGRVKLDSLTDLLKNLDTNDLVSLEGEVSAYAYKEAGEVKLLEFYNTWDIQATLTTTGASTPITAPTNITIASNGLVVSGTSIPSSTVEIYSNSNSLLGSATTITDGTFTITFGSPELSGRQLKAYTVTPEGNRSSPTYFYSKNTEKIKPLDCISISSNGLIVRGNTSRGSTVKVFNSSNVALGTATANSYGNFTITVSSALLTGDTIRIEATLGVSLTTSLTSYLVTIKDIQAPYNIEYNLERTVFTGKAEPLSVITFGYTGGKLKAVTKEDGSFSIYTFANPIDGAGDLAIDVQQETRVNGILLNLSELESKTIADPVVKESLATSSTSFLSKTITPVLGTASNATFDILYDTMINEIELVGDSPTGKELVWEANLKIIKKDIGV